MIDELPPPPVLTRQDAMAIHRRACGSCQIILDEGIAEWKNQCDSCFSDPSTKRDCSICVKPRIPAFEPAWRLVCTTCYKDAERRNCISCNEATIPEYEPEWRKICRDCYNDKSKYRHCVICKENTIKPGSKSFMRQCGKCWLEKKSRTYKKCPVCKDPRLTCLKTQSICKVCRKKEESV